MRLSFTCLDCAESALLVDFGSHYSKALSLCNLGSQRAAHQGGATGSQGKHPGAFVAYSVLRSLATFEGAPRSGNRSAVRYGVHRAQPFAVLRYSGCLWRRIRSRPYNTGAAGRLNRSRGNRAPCGSALPRLHAGFPAGLCLSRRFARSFAFRRAGQRRAPAFRPVLSRLRRT